MSARTLVAVLALGFAAAAIDAAQAAQASATFSVGMTILPAGTAAPLRPADPLAASTWHAVDGPWPGNVRFDDRTRTVHLELDGAQPIDAAYRAVVEAAPAGRPDTGPHGRLHITQTNGLTVDLAFRLSHDGRTLTLVSERSAMAQHYVRVAFPGQTRDPYPAQTATRGK